MAELNSYLWLADNDYAYAKGGMSIGDKIGNYNGVASTSAQSAEKYLKAVIEECFGDREDLMELLHSHNLGVLHSRVVTKCELRVSSKDCKWLGDFYYDAGYPGDNFVVVNREDAEECLRILETLSRDVHAILEAEDSKREEQRKILSKLKAFD